uniref:Uncharacterized protein n=1 Tax=Anguilla anguilla TaxID=7936 RepID=A0A0E9WE86_ANGAN
MSVTSRVQVLAVVLDVIVDKGVDEKVAVIVALLQTENHRDLLLSAGSNQVVWQQLSSREELVVTTLVNEDV